MQRSETSNVSTTSASESLSIGVIVRCRNEEAHIGRLLTGITRQTLQPKQIIVVDSGSTDATIAIASAFPVKVVQMNANDFSFGAACNLGAENCDADVGVFVSAHCYPVYDSWLEQLTTPFADPVIGLSYGRQVSPPGGRFSETRLFAQWFPENSVSRQDIPFCNNANAAIRMNAWRGGIKYDEEITGLEDVEWAKRAMQDGLEIAYVAEAPVAHVHDETWAQVVNRYQREAIAHRSIYEQPAMRRRLAIRLGALSIARDYSAARRARVLSSNLIDIPKFRAAQYYGTYRGFKQSGPVAPDLKHRFYFPEDDAGSNPMRDEDVGQAIDYEERVGPSERP